MCSVYRHSDLFLDAHFRANLIHLRDESTTLLHGMNQEVKRRSDDRISSYFFPASPVPRSDARELNLRLDVSLVQSELVRCLCNDTEINDWPMGFAANGQACVAKQIHEPGNTFGKPHNLFQYLYREWGGCTAEARGMQPLGDIGAHLGQA